MHYPHIVPVIRNFDYAIAASLGRQFMMTSSNADIFRVTVLFCATGEFPSQKPVTLSFDVLFDLCLNK